MSLAFGLRFSPYAEGGHRFSPPMLTDINKQTHRAYQACQSIQSKVAWLLYHGRRCLHHGSVASYQHRPRRGYRAGPRVCLGFDPSSTYTRVAQVPLRSNSAVSSTHGRCEHQRARTLCYPVNLLHLFVPAWLREGRTSPGHQDLCHSLELKYFTRGFPLGPSCSTRSTRSGFSSVNGIILVQQVLESIAYFC